MKHCVQIVGLLLLILSFNLNAQEKQPANLDTKVSIHVEEGRLIDLFNQISTQTGIYFSYDPILVDAEKPLSFSVKDQPIKTILKNIFDEQFHFKLLKNQLIITKRRDQLRLTFNKDSAGIRYQLSGKLVNREDQTRVPYASISILGHPFGTISNVDGEFRMKIPAEYESDTLVISCMGYARLNILLDTLQRNELAILLTPIEIQLQEVKVTATDALEVMDKMMNNLAKNYATNSLLMNSFYREVLKQDKDYINVSEAVMDILKSSYTSQYRQDQIRYLKGRKSKEVPTAFQLVDFKMQGGPYYITKLDVIKTRDSFVDPEFREYYKYRVDRIIQYLNRPTIIIHFEPNGKYDYLTYEGELYIDRETYALVHAEFSLSKGGKKTARKSLIKKKPRGFNVRPIDLDYTVTYKQHHNKWYLSTAQTSVKFHVKSRHDKINSVFHSISDLLITDYRETNLRRFKRHEDFNSSDIFVEIITDYDEDFWGEYNVIKPSEDLRKALKKGPSNTSSSHDKTKPNQLTSQKTSR